MTNVEPKFNQKIPTLENKYLLLKELDKTIENQNEYYLTRDEVFSNIRKKLNNH